MKNIQLALVYLSLISTSQAMDLCDSKESHSGSTQQVVVHNMPHYVQDNPTFLQSMAQGALTGAMNHACGLNNESAGAKEAAIGGAVKGVAQGLRRAYVILKHLQS